MTNRIEPDSTSTSTALLTKKEFAAELRVSVRTVERYIADDVIKAQKLSGGRLVRISRTELDKVISS